MKRAISHWREGGVERASSGRAVFGMSNYEVGEGTGMYGAGRTKEKFPVFLLVDGAS